MSGQGLYRNCPRRVGGFLAVSSALWPLESSGAECRRLQTAESAPAGEPSLCELQGGVRGTGELQGVKSWRRGGALAGETTSFGGVSLRGATGTKCVRREMKTERKTVRNQGGSRWLTNTATNACVTVPRYQRRNRCSGVKTDGAFRQTKHTWQPNDERKIGWLTSAFSRLPAITRHYIG